MLVRIDCGSKPIKVDLYKQYCLHTCYYCFSWNLLKSLEGIKYADQKTKNVYSLEKRKQMKQVQDTHLTQS